jgi:hypothetical protein
VAREQLRELGIRLAAPPLERATRADA